MINNDIVPSDRTTGVSAAHTIAIPSLQTLLASLPTDADLASYKEAVVDQNILAKKTGASRKQAFADLQKLYLLQPEKVLFRALRDLWDGDPAGQRLLAGLCALARDSVLRASSKAITASNVGEELSSQDLALPVDAVFPGSYNQTTLALIGRMTYSSWEQIGHLGPSTDSTKTRRQPMCTPAVTTYALFLGHLEGVQGAALFDTFWVSILGQPRERLIDMATTASQRLLIDFRNSAGVIEVGFRELLRPMQGQLL